MPDRATRIVVHAPMDNTEHYGSRGELWAGGRKAAGLGDWHYKATLGGWMVRAGVHNPDERLIDEGAEFEVRLLFGNATPGKKTDYIFIGPALTVTRLPNHPEIVAIVGTQKLEKIERYGSGNKGAAQQQQGFRAVRAIRDIPGGAGHISRSVPRASRGFEWDAAQRRFVVRGR